MWRLGVVLGLLALAMGLLVLAAVAGVASQACTAAGSGPVGGVPAALVVLFEGAAGRYGLGPEGAAVLAAINYQESDFGASRLPGVRSGMNAAGAAGPMQIGVGGRAGDTWDRVKVTSPGDPPGQAPSVYDEADAVYSAAHYLAIEGMTADQATWARAVYAYNHARWYVQQVLARAQRYYQAGLPAAGAQAVSWPGPQQCSIQTGAYADPFGAVPAGHLVAERIDQGVDYADGSPDPILALGDATVTYAGPDPGWLGSAVNYTLVDGPYAGRFVYVAESVTPTVHVGQQVLAGQQVATFAEPNVHGIETGWAAGPGPFAARASELGQAARAGDPGAERTACGENFSELLAQLGAPPGLAEARPVVGSGC